MSSTVPDLAAAEDFPTAARMVLRYLHDNLPLESWAITRVDGDAQTFLFLERDNDFGLRHGDEHPFEAGFCVRMVDGHAPNVAPDIQAVPEYAAAAVNDAFRIGTYAGAPVYEPDGRLFGTICGLDPDKHVEDEALAHAGPILQLLGQLLSMALRADRTRAETEAALVKATLEAETDLLTGLHNRRAWERLLAEESAVFARFHDPTVVAMLDLDLLKTVNDTYGHRAGDDYIRRAADALRRAARDADSVARLGGDEFGMLLRRCTQEEAQAAVARIYDQLAAEGVAGSVGWAPISVVQGLDSAVQEADAAMYAAKRERRATRAREQAPAGQ